MEMLVHSTIIEELRASNGIGFDKFSDLTKCVFDGDNDQLLTLFHIEEFQEVVSSMHLDKASGPDSMKSTFFQQCWSIFRDFYSMLTRAMVRREVSLKIDISKAYDRVD
ncbi:hypothetical protein PVK06_003356 [Gossypium arboreum]|uniref:Reverse transcriptase domain-containing protein n=1 Tax=Gossypium arboreum TaxID=29729 RepID=A0ABR0R7A0_GOSAR|nr:hypothetical protein PVK06_003356 [Gossypium arboreum]